MEAVPEVASSPFTNYTNRLSQTIVGTILSITQVILNPRSTLRSQDFEIFISDYVLTFMTHTCQQKFRPEFNYLLSCASFIVELL